ncbi:MAG TPA: YceI family protein [Patescibacteria group bacterium]|nr:YceI family protein [Patescibacteria group bacterium]
MKHLLLALLILAAPALAIAEETAAAAEAPVLAAETPAPPAAREWTLLPRESTITFRGKQMGKEFDGEISTFKAQIWFDPEQLDQSKVIVDIDLMSIDARDTDRNKSLLGPEWLDVQQFPVAHFETVNFAKKEDGSYIASATLTMHGMPVEVQLPFTLDIKQDSGKDKAIMTGKVTLDRSKFALGTGDWADPSVIANEVDVTVTVAATAPAGTK